MNSEQVKTDINLSTVPDNLPLVLIWRRVLKEVWSAINFITIIVFIFLVFILGFAGLIFITSMPGLNQAWIFFAFMAVFIAATSYGTIRDAAKKIRQSIRAEAFAGANGFSFLTGRKGLIYPGLIFSIGDTKNAFSLIGGNYHGRVFQLFNYSYMEGSGKNRREYNKGVIMVKLPRKLPNVVFDSRSNNLPGISSTGATFKRSQRLRLEGDFNNHFDVYAPQNYGRDVLYFMTPELMALLVDKARGYDIEVVDDDLFFYAPEFDYKKPQLESIFQLIESVGGEFLENTARYADERMGDKNVNMIAEPGRRLKRGFSWVSIVVVVAYAVYLVVSKTK